MLDFLIVSSRNSKRGTIEVYPKFKVGKPKDLLIRGGDFYAIWNEETKLWSTNEEVAIQLIDKELERYAKGIQTSDDTIIKILYMWDSESGSIDKWHHYVQKHLRDSYHVLDEKLVFSNMETTKEDYASKKLPYPLKKGDITYYDELISTLYTPEERLKIEWAIGAIVTGESKNIQKFVVMYGSAGTGKSTILNIIQDLFEGYYSVFDAKALGSLNNSFALESFKTNPLVAIQHDGDLSRIEDNTRLNSVVSHELMTVNEKFKSAYASRFNCFLFMGTNKPVKITDAKSGIIRRLIDVSPSGNKLNQSRYRTVTSHIKFELGAIAYHCKEVYEQNRDIYNDYKPISMIGATNDFFNFVMDKYEVFEREQNITLASAYAMYDTYCTAAKVLYPYPRRAFKEELKNYFKEFYERYYDKEKGLQIRNYYMGFTMDEFDGDIPNGVVEQEEIPEGNTMIEFQEQSSLFDEECRFYPAQYATEDEKPIAAWDYVKTTLAGIDTTKLHYVRVPENHIVIDFDLKDEKGEKSFERNLEAASKWPETYAELSKSGCGIHLHYIYDGDPERLSRIYDKDIEIKVFSGKSSLRRKLTKCNDIPIKTISAGLPLREEKKVIDYAELQNEKALRAMITKALQRKIHQDTKSNIDYISMICDEAQKAGYHYNVEDMYDAIMSFALNSTHNAEYCMKKVVRMELKSKNEPAEIPVSNKQAKSEELVFYDVEVFPNLFVIVWKFMGGSPVVMINPTAAEVSELLEYKLIGFNCRKYDNHILYARIQGYSLLELYELSQKIIRNESNCLFPQAYNISYTDVYDFSSKKQSLKKFEIELGIHHKELGLPWDKPVPEEMWEEVGAYCINDVIATEEVFKARSADWTARQILAKIADGSVNDTTNTLTTKIVFGKERRPQLVYTDFSTGEQFGGSSNAINKFEGYEYIPKNTIDKERHNMYKGIDVGFGGLVLAQHGMYGRTVCFDVSGMHPASIRALNALGEYTRNYLDIVDARTYIKHKEFDKVRGMLDGKLAPYLNDENQAKELSKALKLAVNSVYGLTSAGFDNPFKDSRNINNIVALRGALFMVNLKEEVEKRGFTVIHIKTDSIKVLDPSPEIAEFITNYGRMYGYEFEIEHIFEKICLVNNAVYIGKLAEDDPEDPGKWTATGAQFAVPYVFKTLFSHEAVIFDDLTETKNVSKGAIYLDMNEEILQNFNAEHSFLLPDDYLLEYDLDKYTKKKYKIDISEEDVDQLHDYHFVGKVGRFCPVKPTTGGGLLVCRVLDDPDPVKASKANAVNGAKGYRWMEAEDVKNAEKEDDIDYSYFNKLVDEAIESLRETAEKSPSNYRDVEAFIEK